MSKHSKGPWEQYSRLSGSENHRGYVIRNAVGFVVAEGMPIDTDGIEGAANASLIAAAPTMRDYIEKQADSGCNEAAKILEVVNGNT